MRLKKIKDLVFLTKDAEGNDIHKYEYMGRELMGVTSLMKKHGLAPDYRNIDPEVLKKAAERGTALHKLLEDYDDGMIVSEDDENNLAAYKSLGLSVHCSEYLVSDCDVVASSIDKVLEDCSLADVKHTSQVHTEAVTWQLSIYAYLFEKMNPSKKVPHIYCLHVRDGVAKKIELNRIPGSEVEKLLQAERDGLNYQDVIADELPGIDDLPVASNREVVELVEALSIVANYKEMLKAAEDKVKELTENVHSFMSNNGLRTLQCDRGTFSVKAAYVRTSLDSASLKKDMPEIYEKYQKTTEVKETIVFKSNK